MCVTEQDRFKYLSVTDLREISCVDLYEYIVTDLEQLFEVICFTLEDLENQKLDFISKDLCTDFIEDDIYEIEVLQYDVQSQIEYLEV